MPIKRPRDIAYDLLNDKKYEEAIKAFLELINPLDKNIDVGLQRGLAQSYHRAGKLAQAEKIYQSLMKFNHVPTYYSYAVFLFDQKKYQEAKEVLTQITVLEPDHEPAYNLKCSIFEKEKKYAEAIGVIKQIIALFGENEKKSLNLAINYAQNQERTMAISTLEQATLKYKSLQIYLHLARFYEENGDNEKAKETYKTLDSLFPNNEKVNQSYAIFLEKIGASRAAAAQFAKLKTGTLSRAIFLEKDGQSDKALLEVDEIIRQNPEKPEGYIAKAKIFLKLKDFNNALSCYHYVLNNIDQDNIDVKLGIGFVYLDKEEFQQALAQFEALESTPEASFRAIQGKIRALEEIGQAELALSIAIECKQKYPTNKAPLLLIARLYQRMKRYDEALAEFHQLLNEFPKDEVDELGFIRLKIEMGHLDESCKLSWDLRDKYPNYREAYLCYANVLESMGNYTDGKIAFQTAVNRFPHYREARVGYSILLGEMGRYRDALNEINRARSLFPYDIDCWLVEGRLRSDMGDLNEAGMIYWSAYQNFHSQSALLGFFRTLIAKNQPRQIEDFYSYMQSNRLLNKEIELAYSRFLQEYNPKQALTQYKNLVIEYPEFQAALLSQARFLQEKKYHEAAITKYCEFLEKFPLNPKGWLSQAKFWEETGNIHGALSSFCDLYQRFPSNKDGLVHFANFLSKEFTKAEVTNDLINQCISEFPCAAHIFNSNADPAEVLFAEIYQKYPYYPKAQLFYIQANSQFTHPEEVKKNYQLLFERFPYYQLGYLSYIDYLFAQNRGYEAYENLLEYRGHFPHNTIFYIKQIEMLLDLREINEAKIICEFVLKKFPYCRELLNFQKEIDNLIKLRTYKTTPQFARAQNNPPFNTNKRQRIPEQSEFIRKKRCLQY